MLLWLKSSPFPHLAPRTGRWGIDRSIIQKHYNMALVESSGPTKHTKVSSEDVRLKKV